MKILLNNNYQNIFYIFLYPQKNIHEITNSRQLFYNSQKRELWNEYHSDTILQEKKEIPKIDIGWKLINGTKIGLTKKNF